MVLRVFASILVLMALPGRAQTPVEDTRSAAISDARMRSLLRGMALDFTEDPAGDSIVFSIHLDGHLVRLLNRGDGLSLSSCFENPVDLMKANQWNREHFSTRAYLDEAGCISLAADLHFGGGLTNQMIPDFVRVFCTDVAVFARFLAKSSAGPDTPASSPPAKIQSLDRLALPIGAMAWSQLGPPTKLAPSWPGTSGSVPGLLKIDPRVSLKYDPDQWKAATPHGHGLFAFSNLSGGGHAIVIAERTTTPLDSVEDVALANAQSVDPHAKIVFRHRKWVKGVAYWFLQIEATVETIPMVYWGYFYTGEGGTVQVVTYTEKSRLTEYEQGFMDFLNGLMVSR